MLESLETRRLLSAGVTATLSRGALMVTAGSGNNFVAVVEDHGNVLVNNVHAGTSQSFTGVTSIRINGQAKVDDLYYTGNSIGAVIDANGGIDNIVIADTGTGSSYAIGNGGDDNFTVIIGHRTTVVGGGGNDLFFLNTDSSGQFNVAAAETFAYGDGGDDTFIANAGINHMDGGGGKDLFITFAGSNTVSGGGGNDTLIQVGGTNIVDSIETTF